VKLQHSVSKLQTLPDIGNFKLSNLKFFIKMIEKVTLVKSAPGFPGGKKKWNETEVGEYYYWAITQTPGRSC